MGLVLGEDEAALHPVTGAVTPHRKDDDSTVSRYTSADDRCSIAMHRLLKTGSKL